MMTCVQPTSRSIAADTSPVKAPLGSQWRSCAASSTCCREHARDGLQGGERRRHQHLTSGEAGNA